MRAPLAQRLDFAALDSFSIGREGETFAARFFGAANAALSAQKFDVDQTF
jgi:hypothetical protein